MLRESMFYKKNGDKILCELCPHGCRLSENDKSLCMSRKVLDGKLYSIGYGMISSLSLDPIEKKPLYHFKPGSKILSVGSFGCNFKCKFCQNYSISQFEAESEYIPPEYLIQMAQSREDNIGIAFTYNEPFISFEYIYDVCKMAQDKNLCIVLVTNGYVNPNPLKELLPYVDALNIDLKAFNDKYYREVCFGDVETVKKTIEIASKESHVEVTTLLVNGLNDSDEEVGELSKWLSEINPNIPLHLSRYFPRYKMDKEATPVERILSCQREAKKYLNFVYVGNVDNVDNNTYCPKCGRLLVERNGYDVKTYTKDGKCMECGEDIGVEL